MIEAGDLNVRAAFPGESLDGYVADIVGDNELRRVRSVSAIAGVAYGHRPQLSTTGWNSLPALADLLEIDVEELRLRSYPPVGDEGSRRAFFGTTVHRSDLRTRERFFAPARLAKAAYHQAMWQLRLPYDVESGELLIATCPRPECGKVQRWSRSAGVRWCDICVEDLATCDVPRLADDLLPAYRLAAGLTHSDPAVRHASLSQLPDEIQAVGEDMAYELLIRLVPLAEPGCGWKSATRIWHNHPEEIARGMAAAWDLLRGWPESVTARVGRDLANGQKRHDDGNGGATRRFFNTRKAEGLPASVRRLIDGLGDDLRLDGPNRERLRATTLTVVEAAAILNLGTKDLAETRRGGVFRTIAALRRSLLVPLFDRDEILEMASLMKSRLALNSVNDRIGLPYYAVEQIAGLGHFPPPAHRFFEGRYASRQTTTEALQSFLDSLLVGSTSASLGGEQLKHLMRAVGGGLKPWNVIVAAMLAGDLPYRIDEGDAPLFDRIRVERQSFRALLNLPSERRWTPPVPAGDGASGHHPVALLTKRDCTEILNLTDRAVTLLLAHYPTSTGPIVPVADVEALASTHMTSSELAARLGASVPEVRAAAASLGIRPSTAAGFPANRDADLAAAVLQRIAQRSLSQSSA